MKNIPKKIAVCLDLSKLELNYLLFGLEQVTKVFNSSRNYDEEDLHETKQGFTVFGVK